MNVASNMLSIMKFDVNLYFVLFFLKYNNCPPKIVHTIVTTIVAIKAENTLIATKFLAATRKPIMNDKPTVCKNKHT